MDQSDIIWHMEKAIDLILKTHPHHADIDQVDEDIRLLEEDIQVQEITNKMEVEEFQHELKAC